MNSNNSVPSRSTRRRRAQLSCAQCRWKKVSCDRLRPCQRCKRAGRPELCSFDTNTGNLTDSVTHETRPHAIDEVASLKAEVAQLKELLVNTHVRSSSDPTSSSEEAQRQTPAREAVPRSNSNVAIQVSVPEVHTKLLNPRQRVSRGYYHQHTSFQFFKEIPQLFPFIQEVSHESLTPRGIFLSKKSITENKGRETADNDAGLEEMIPPQHIADALITFYIKYVEHIHRIVHVPAFKREYAKFWVPGARRSAAMTSLVLSVMSVSIGMLDDTKYLDLHLSSCWHLCARWLAACDSWLKQQGTKHNKLVQYQVACLVHLAKRVHMIKKKKYWKDTGSLLQSAIMDGLHHQPSSEVDNPYNRELKRRIWATTRELDLQSSFEFGLPTLLHNIDTNVGAPTNVEDETFNEHSEFLPPPVASGEYTRTSYQVHSSRSWNLRLEISRKLYHTGTAQRIPYEEVLLYTHRLTQEMQLLPPWGVDSAQTDTLAASALTTYAFLYSQLTECLLAIHRPYLQSDISEFWLSQNLCFQMSKDVLMLHEKLFTLPSSGLTFIRSDVYTASLSLLRISMIQHAGSTSLITSSYPSTIDLLEVCVPYVENRFLQSFDAEPWCAMIMYTVIMLLKIHIGIETWTTAKSACTARFLALYNKSCSSFPRKHQVMPLDRDGQTRELGGSDGLLPVDTSLPTGHFGSGEIDMDDLASFMVNLDDAWGTWDWTWPDSGVTGF